VVQQYGTALDAKIIIDITNTFDLGDYGGRHVPADTFVAQEIAEVAGETAQVFKAFNTISGTVFSRNEQMDALFAGNDGRAGVRADRVPWRRLGEGVRPVDCSTYLPPACRDVIDVGRPGDPVASRVDAWAGLVLQLV
jgi:predicted dinucleotide-binding enzyme